MTHHSNDRPTQAASERAPASTHNNAHVRFNHRQPSQQAGILCNDPQFQKFAARRCGVPTDALSSTAAAEYLRQVCRVASRRELNTNRNAAHRFQQLRANFDAWCGRISSPRQDSQ